MFHVEFGLSEASNRHANEPRDENEERVENANAKTSLCGECEARRCVGHSQRLIVVVEVIYGGGLIIAIYLLACVGERQERIKRAVVVVSNDNVRDHWVIECVEWHDEADRHGLDLHEKERRQARDERHDHKGGKHDAAIAASIAAVAEAEAAAAQSVAVHVANEQEALESDPRLAHGRDENDHAARERVQVDRVELHGERVLHTTATIGATVGQEDKCADECVDQVRRALPQHVLVDGLVWAEAKEHDYAHRVGERREDANQRYHPIPPHHTEHRKRSALHSCFLFVFLFACLFVCFLFLYI